MIYVHTFYTGKFNSAKNVRVYDSRQKAMMQKAVLGGTIKECTIASTWLQHIKPGTVKNDLYSHFLYWQI